MRKKNKYSVLLISLLFFNSTIFAISPTGTVTGIGQSSQIGSNIFPVSSHISYDVYNFNFIENFPTNFTFKINGGYGTRSIGQDPISGLATWCDKYNKNDHGDFIGSGYGIIFSGWETVFTQPIPLPGNIPGSFNIWTGASVHYEQAIDKLEVFRTKDPYSETTIFDKLKDIDSSTIFYGTPDLAGNRYLHDFSLNLGTFYNNKIKDIPYTVSLTGNLAPRWLLNNLSAYDAKSNYFQITPSFSISKSLYRENYKDLFNGSSFRLFEFTISNSLSYRYLNGTAVPQYKISYGNVRHDINNTFALNFYGPQVLAADCYPYLKLYYNADFSWGKLNNLDPQFNEKKAGELTHLVGAVLDLRIIGIIHVGYRANFQFSVNSGYSFGHSPYFYVQL